MKRILFIDTAARRRRAAKAALLLAACCGVMLNGCMMTRKSSTVTAVVFDSPPIEALPLAADVAVTPQKGTGEASGRSADIDRLIREATARALNQDPPSADGADLLAGMEVFTETRGYEAKVTVTGYRAYYTNFRTAPPDTINRDQRDSLKREEYSEIFAIARTLKEMADEDSAQVEVFKSGKSGAAVKITYLARHVPSKNETVKNPDGSVSKIVDPVYHSITVDDAFDIGGAGRRVKKSPDRIRITETTGTMANKSGESKKGGGVDTKGVKVGLGVGGGLLIILLFIL